MLFPVLRKTYLASCLIIFWDELGGPLLVHQGLDEPTDNILSNHLLLT